MKTKDIASYIFLALTWGMSFLVTLHVVKGFGWVGAVAFRAFIAAGTLYLIARVSGLVLNFQTGWKRFAVLGLSTVTLQLIGLSYAIPRIGTAMSAICVASIPLFSMVISQLWGLERITMRGLTGLLLGFFGIVVLVGFPAQDVTPSFILGCAAALIACAASAYGSNYASRNFRGIGSWEMTIGSFLFGGILCLPLLIVVPVPGVPGFTDFLYLFTAACLMSGLTYLLYFRLVASIGPTKAVSVEFVVTVIAVLVGALYLNEPLSMLQFIGAAVIITGCSLVLSARSASHPEPKMEAKPS